MATLNRARRQAKVAAQGGEDHAEEVDEAPFGDLPREGIVTPLVEVRGARPVTRLAAPLNDIAGVTSVHVGDRNHPSD